jgi:predicted NBD/HSP70 family sugar kinase
MYFAIDIGGTKTIINGYKDLDLDTLVFSEMLKTDRNFESHINRLRKIIELHSEDSVDGIGLAHVGIIDKEKQICVDSANLPEYINKPIIKLLSRGLTNNTYIENDLVCGALAEAKFGYGKNYERLLYFTASTGIGAAYAYKVDNKTYVQQIEAGFFVIKGMGLSHQSGQVDIIEAYVGGKSMEERFLSKPEDIQDLLLWENQVDYLTTAVVNSLVMFNTDVLVLGGGMIENNEYLKEKLIQKIKIELVTKSLPAIKVSQMKKSVAVNGALALLINS